MKTSIWLSAALHPTLRRKAEVESSRYPLRLPVTVNGFRGRTAGKNTEDKLLARFPDKVDAIKYLAENDPTPNNNWLMPMWNWYLKSPDTTTAEDIRQAVRGLYLADLEEVKKLWPKPTRPTPADWRTAEDCLDWLRGTNPPARLLKENADYEVIYEDDTWKIYQINNKEAACVIGADSDWCFTKWHQSHYEIRKEGVGDPYIAANKKDPPRSIAYRIRNDKIVEDNFTTVFKNDAPAARSIEWSQLKQVLGPKLGFRPILRFSRDYWGELSRLLGGLSEEELLGWQMTELPPGLLEDYLRFGLTDPVAIETLNNGFCAFAESYVGPNCGLDSPERIALAEQLIARYKSGESLEEALGYGPMQLTDAQLDQARKLGLKPDTLMDWRKFIFESSEQKRESNFIGDYLDLIKKWQALDRRPERLSKNRCGQFDVDELFQTVADYKIDAKALYDTYQFTTIMEILLEPESLLDHNYGASNTRLKGVVLPAIKARGMTEGDIQILKLFKEDSRVLEYIETPQQFNAVSSVILEDFQSLLDLDQDVYDIREPQNKIKLLVNVMNAASLSQDTVKDKEQAVFKYLQGVNNLAAKAFKDKKPRYEKIARTHALKELSNLLTKPEISVAAGFTAPVAELVDYINSLNINISIDDREPLDPIVVAAMKLGGAALDASEVAKGYLLRAKTVKEVRIASYFFDHVNQPYPVGGAGSDDGLHPRALLRHLVRHPIDLTEASIDFDETLDFDARTPANVINFLAQFSGYTPEGFKEDRESLPGDLAILWLMALLMHVTADNFRNLSVDEMRRLIYRSREDYDLGLLSDIAQSCLALTGHNSAAAAALGMIVRDFFGEADVPLDYNPLADYRYSLSNPPIPWSNITSRNLDARAAQDNYYIYEQADRDIHKALHDYLDYLQSGLSLDEFSQVRYPDSGTLETPEQPGQAVQPSPAGPAVPSGEPPPTSSVRIGASRVLGHQYGATVEEPRYSLRLAASVDGFRGRTATRFWGRAGAGMLIVCPEDRTALLTLRSGSVMDPYTWGIPGGAIGKGGFYENEGGPSAKFKADATRQGAERETLEELSVLPRGVQELGTTVFRSGTFTYTTYVVGVSLEEKKRLSSQIRLNWENDDAQWFPLNVLPDDLHSGVTFTMSQWSLDDDAEPYEQAQPHDDEELDDEGFDDEEPDQDRIARTARLVQKSKDGKKQWALVSTKDSSKVLKWFGAKKPSEDTVAKEERRVQYFKHKG